MLPHFFEFLFFCFFFYSPQPKASCYPRNPCETFSPTFYFISFFRSAPCSCQNFFFGSFDLQIPGKDLFSFPPNLHLPSMVLFWPLLVFLRYQYLNVPPIFWPLLGVVFKSFILYPFPPHGPFSSSPYRFFSLSIHQTTVLFTYSAAVKGSSACCSPFHQSPACPYFPPLLFFWFGVPCTPVKGIHGAFSLSIRSAPPPLSLHFWCKGLRL